MLLSDLISDRFKKIYPWLLWFYEHSTKVFKYTSKDILVGSRKNPPENIPLKIAP